MGRTAAPMEAMAVSAAPLYALYTRFQNGAFLLRGDRWALQRLRKLFDSKQFKELSRQVRQQ